MTLNKIKLSLGTPQIELNSARGESHETCRRLLFAAGGLSQTGAHDFLIGEPSLGRARSVRDADLVVYECFHVIDKPGDREGRPQRIQAGLPGEFYAIYDHRSS